MLTTSPGLRDWHVYKITCLANGKVYVGKTHSRYRWSAHKSLAMHGGGGILHKAIRKYGPNAFLFERIESCDSEVSSFERERHWIATLGCKVPGGYNLTDGGEGVSGYRHREENKQKMARHGAANGCFGRVWTTEERAAHAERTRQQLAENGHPFSGRTHKPETKAKISAGMMGHKRCVGRKYSAETIAKMSASHKGCIPWQRLNPLRTFIPKAATPAYMKLWRIGRMCDQLEDRLVCVDAMEYEEDRHPW